MCRGGDHGDTHTFALNLRSGMYLCHRGSCGARGSIAQLAARFGEQAALPADTSVPAKGQKQYALPSVTILPRTGAIDRYFAARKITPATLDAYGIGADAQGNILFPFRRGGVLVYLKYRKPVKPAQGERKEWQAKGAQPILFGMDLCAFDQPLVITEGQIDALSLAEAGVPNAVSVPCGSDSLEWIEACWDWLERFPAIVLFGDNDVPGRRMVQQVARRLDESRCRVVEAYPLRPDGRPCKDANEMLYFHGPAALLDALRSAQAVPIKGVVPLSEVAPADPTAAQRIKTTLPALDEALGGLVEGGLTVFTGKPGDGKSTLAGQLLLSAIEQGHSVCAYSGELTPERFQSWIHFQLAGSAYIGLKHDPVRGVPVPHIAWPVQQRLMDYYRGKFFLFNNHEVFQDNLADEILRVFTAVARRHGCKLFLVDNLMTALSDTDEETRAQGRFANLLRRFANQFAVHVILVAHPRKTRFGEAVKQDDIGGNSATIRLADSAIVVERPHLRIIKNRDGGVQKFISCCYCPDSRRIYQADKGDLSNFRWNREGLTPPATRADSLPEYMVYTGNPF